MGRTITNVNDIVSFIYLNPSDCIRIVSPDELSRVNPYDRLTSYISVNRVTNEIFLARRKPHAEIFNLRKLTSHTSLLVEEIVVRFDSFHSTYVLFAVDNNVINRFIINNHILDNVINKVLCDDSR